MIKSALFFSLLFLTPLTFADTDFSGELKCFQQVADGFGSGNYHPLNNGRDAIYMLRDGNIGGVPDNSKANSGFFNIQNQKIQFCPLPWGNSKAANVKFTDSQGETVKLTRRLAEPYFQEGGEWFTSYRSIVCEDVSSSLKTSQMLRDIMMAAIKKQAEAGKPYSQCLNTRQIRIQASDLPDYQNQGTSSQDSAPNSQIEQ